MRSIFWAGSYAKPEEKGLLCCAYDPENGFEILAEHDGLLNPSFLIFHPRVPVLYTVEETREGAACAWRIDGGKLTLLDRIPSGGADPCHLALSQDGAWLYVTNYTGGSVACFSVGEDGRLLSRTDLRQHTGHSVHPQRQEAAHVHFVRPEGKRLKVCDLGLDCVMTYLNQDGKLVEEGRVPAPPGCGPRHLASTPTFPDLLYCVTELAASVLVFRRLPGGDLSLVTARTAVPEGGNPEYNTAAAIHFAGDGRRLLVSHRGMDAIAVMTLDDEGMPSAPVLSPCVRVPRDFLILGEDVLVASQQDGIIQAYRMEGNRLNPLPWKLEANCPVCLCEQ